MPTPNHKRTFGLIGRTLAHSFSPRYFAEKFAREGMEATEYLAFELAQIEEFPALLAQTPTLRGLNVTIPYKEQVMPYLGRLSEAAAAIGAVNTIAFEEGQLVGYNTDAEGFRLSLLEQLQPEHRERLALVLGTGGASKAVCYVLDQLGMAFKMVSRTPQADQWTYTNLTPGRMASCGLIVNTTPLGTYPAVENCPTLPYEALGPEHLLYDLIYNPAETLFLRRGKDQGTATYNGWAMLQLQAEAAWRIWNRP